MVYRLPSGSIPACCSSASSWRRGLGGLLTAVLLFSARAAIAEAPLPASLQAVIFKKVLGYDKGLPTGALKVVILAGSADTAAAADVAKSFQDQGFTSSIVDAVKLERELASSKVVYLFPDMATAAVRAVCARSGALTLAGDTQLVEDGKVAIALGKRDDGRPAIVINRTELHAQGHEISSDLLRLARIVQ